MHRANSNQELGPSHSDIAEPAGPLLLKAKVCPHELHLLPSDTLLLLWHIRFLLGCYLPQALEMLGYYRLARDALRRALIIRQTHFNDQHHLCLQLHEEIDRLNIRALNELVCRLLRYLRRMVRTKF